MELKAGVIKGLVGAPAKLCLLQCSQTAIFMITCEHSQYIGPHLCSFCVMKAVEERVRAGHSLPELFQCHGTSDELVLHQWGEDTSVLLQKAGMKTAFHSLPGLNHQISLQEMELLKAWILQKLPSS